MNKNFYLLEDYIQIKGLSKGLAPLLTELICLQNKDGAIVVNASLKRNIGSRINATVGSLNNKITQFIEAGILIRIDRGFYTFCDELKELKANYNINEMKIVYDNEVKNIKINGGTK